MTDVLLKAFSLVFIILLGYSLKKLGVFKKDDYRVISKIALNITLPGAIITSFTNFEMNMSFLFIIVLGLFANVFLFSLGYLLSRKKDSPTRAFCMLNFPGYNIGAFTLPYIQSFLGSFGVVVACMFDAGNALMCTGGSYALTSNILVKEDSTIKAIQKAIKKLFTSVPFDTYIILLTLSLCHVSLPKPVITVTSTIGSANGFMAMLMLGMMIEINFKPVYLKQIITALSMRYLFAAVFSILIYFCSPFPLQIRQILAIIAFSPISAMTPVFTEKCKGDASLSSFAGSISIIISITIMTILMIVLKI